MEDELGVTGFLVAITVGSADEDVAWVDDPVNNDALAIAWPLVHLSLDGDIGEDFIVFIFAKNVFPKNVFANIIFANNVFASIFFARNVFLLLVGK